MTDTKRTNMTIRKVTAAMDNVLAWRLGEIVRKAHEAPAGDYIDTGLGLLKMLEEKGFVLCYSGPAFPGSHGPL